MSSWVRMVGSAMRLEVRPKTARRARTVLVRLDDSQRDQPGQMRTHAREEGAEEAAIAGRAVAQAGLPLGAPHALVLHILAVVEALLLLRPGLHLLLLGRLSVLHDVGRVGGVVISQGRVSGQCLSSELSTTNSQRREEKESHVKLAQAPAVTRRSRPHLLFAKLPRVRPAVHPQWAQSNLLCLPYDAGMPPTSPTRVRYSYKAAPTLQPWGRGFGLSDARNARELSGIALRSGEAKTKGREWPRGCGVMPYL